MLNKIISFSVKNKLIIGLFVLALIGWGTYEVTRLPIDAVPDITDNQVQVITVSPSLGAPDVERLITFPIEQACSNISGLKQIRSFSRFGLSLVTIAFDDETDVYWARQQISERLQQVSRDIPEGIGMPEMAPVSTGLGEIYQYVVRPLKGYEGKYNEMDLRTIQDWIVRRQLLGTPGVAEVSSFGGKLKQYEIAVRQEQLKAYNLTIGDVFTALEKNNENTGGAYIDKGPTVLYIRSEGLTTSLEEIEKIVVKNLDNGTPLLMRDVATVQFGSAIRYGAMTYNDKGEVAGAVVMMLKGENASVVIKRVKTRIAEIQRMLPEGVVIEPFLDRTKMVNNAISTVESNLVEGALIVIFVLVFFLGNLRAGLIVSSVIPLSMLFAIILMNKFGVGGNLMSLGAIDFGLIVDGSVIVVEAILHRFSHSRHFRHITRLDQDEMDTEVSTSTGTMITSAVFSQIIILIVYLPILSLQGIEGKMFKPMAFTIAFAILGAFLLSVTYVPMMAALFLSKNVSHKITITDRLMIGLERRYQFVLSRVLEFPKTMIAVTVALFAVAVFMLGGMGGEFIPQLEEGDFAVETRLLTGSNLNNTIHSTQQASKILLEKFPEVEKVVTKIGSAEIPTDPMPFEAGDMMVILKNKHEWTSAHTFPELSTKMTKALEEVPGITVGFQFPVQMRFNELMTGARQDVVCKIFGENLDTLTSYADRLTNIIGTVNGAVNIYEEKVTGMPQVVIKYDRDGMAKYGLNVSDINRVVNTAFAGQIAGQVYEGEKRFDMVIRLAGDARKTVADIENLLVPTKQGTQIPLSLVAGINEVEGVNQIQRENTKRRIIVGFNVKDRDVQSIVQELQQKVQQQLHLSRAYNIVYGGSFDNMTAAKERLSIVVPIALAMIFLLLYFAFGSVKQGLLIYSAIPLSATGGIFALWIRDMPFSISAGVGFIALFGVAVLNGILLVSEFNRLKKEGWYDVKRIVIHATKSKLRAVLMTALVPSLGFIPMAISTGAGGEVQKPLASVVIGGLIISTMLTLFVLPMLYIVFEKGFGYFKHRKAVVAAVIVLLFAGSSVRAQEKITLDAAVDSALKNNVAVQVSKTQVSYYQALKKSNVDIAQTAVAVEYGKINSVANDNQFSISQTMQFPTVYKHQGSINHTNMLLSETNLQQKELEVKTSVKQLFYQLLVLQGKRQLLQQADSIYAGFLQKAQQRLNAGDIDVLEKTTAENQRLQITNQLQILFTDYEVLLNQLRMLLNSNTRFEPVADSAIYQLTRLPDTSFLNQSPTLKLQRQQVLLSQQQQQLEKSKLLPTLNAGYNSATIIGWQTTGQNVEQYFGGGKRFNAVNVGVGIPIFSGAQRSRINAAGVLVRQRQQELESTRQQLNTALENSVRVYLRNTALVKTYHIAMLPNATNIIHTATSKLTAGEIGYLDWVLLINQSLQIQSEYLGVVQQLNEAAFEIEHLTAIN
ncbi:cobalt-zinc-cadmium resistance protein CzcA [Chitinophaga costaii]|uniref:Cobalt-zinc-cadmium resistance protein CzcA n=1 Tax=Chitinophaga costaii TaxID=1335309 RepID=A0A1C3Z238_9BACT|nr:CusA/CzcA family heavy metal efflux RND transporter [Chitinophaga costaii]PUZ30198.1 CusA/CzcA family heavy metal efflux RND transporter [Chitinophaga costaii]SCB76352.1 cobalt-zinc-cadmium resistance protein CzcA [Chitinophaga costaii]